MEGILNRFHTGVEVPHEDDVAAAADADFLEIADAGANEARLDEQPVWVPSPRRPFDE